MDLAQVYVSGSIEKDEINVPIALSAFRDGDQGPSKVTKTELIHTLHTKIKSCVIVNVHVTPWFLIERRCRQGDPISPYLFLLRVEILGIIVRENELTNGITFNDDEHKIAQFADDTRLR